MRAFPAAAMQRARLNTRYRQGCPSPHVLCIMSQVFSGIAALLVALLVAWLLHLRPYLVDIGIGRSVESVANTNCTIVPELQACESEPVPTLKPSTDTPPEIVLHQPSGIIYLACSTLQDRVQWMPAVNKLNASGMSGNDHVATYDPQTNVIKRLTLSGFSSPGGLSLHGMDVVASEHDPSVLYVYLVNHRKPVSGDPQKIGADSVIEVFQTQIGDNELTYIRTFEDPTVIITPNDVVGSPDGKSVFFTNDNARKSGALVCHLQSLSQHPESSKYTETVLELDPPALRHLRRLLSRRSRLQICVSWTACKQRNRQRIWPQQ